MAVRDDFAAGEVLAAADLNDTFASKLDLAGGKILQIVRATDSTARSTTSTTFVDVAGMSVTITPQKSDSALWLISVFSTLNVGTSGASAFGDYRLTDNSGNALNGAEKMLMGANISSGTVYSPVVLMAYVTPATTSAVTYKLQFSANAVNRTNTVKNDNLTGQVYAIEVSA